MINRCLASLLLLAVMPFAAACDTYDQDDLDHEVNVESYLVVSEPLPAVRVSATAPIDAEYSFEKYAVEDASVVVNLLNESGGVEESYDYAAVGPGVYESVKNGQTVKPLGRYALEV